MRQFVEAAGRACLPPAFGGQGLPHVVNQCLYEMLNSANQAWTMYPASPTAPTNACAHGTESKGLYLPKLVQRRMDRHHVPDRAHCGTDLGPAAHKAEPQADGTYRITGRRSSSAAASTTWRRTSSTWCWRACPTRRPARASRCSSCPSSWSCADGSLGRATHLLRRLEHKMGINANATCQIGLDGATGWLVGQPHKAWRRCS